MTAFDRLPLALTLAMDDGREYSLELCSETLVRWEGRECPAKSMDLGEVRFLTFDLNKEPRVNLTLVLDPADPRSGWDPTDPDPENPWLQDWQLTAKEATP